MDLLDEDTPAETEARRTTEETEALVGRLIDDAIHYVDETLSDAREEAAKYYRGEPFGNEEDGRSQLVLTEVRDGVLGVLPSLLRVVFGPERIVEFAPRASHQTEMARQATEVVHHIVAEANPGFMLTHSVLKDGLIKKLGVFKIGVDEEPRHEEQVLEAVPLEEAAVLAQEAQAAGAEIEMEDFGDGTARLVLRKAETHKSYKLWAVPPEEFLFNREATSLADATFVGHRRTITTAEALALGIDKETLDEHGGKDSRLRDNPEAEGRREQAGDFDLDDGETAGDENAEHDYVEGYFRLADENGVYGRRKICTLGPTHHIVHDEPVADDPFAVFCPDPEPHTIIGQSYADRLMDMQRFKSSLIRGSADSLALSIFPRMGYVDTKVNTDDIMNTAIGAPIRMREANAIQVIEHPFVGKEALTLLAYADDVVERRTGRNKGTAGLDANALQSSTKEGVASVLAMSQEQQELLARLFVEGTLKPLFRKILQLVIRTQDRPVTTRIQGAWMEVDPQGWDPNLGLSVSAALGTTFLEQRLETLMLIASKQEQLLTQMGPENPLVSLPQLRNTYAELMMARGRVDVDRYFMPLPPDWKPAPPPPPKPSPEEVIAQATLEVEKMKTQKELEIKEAELALKQNEADKAHAFRLREMELAHELKLEEKRLEAEVKVTIEREKLQVQKEIAELKARTDLHKTLQDGVLREEEMDRKDQTVTA